MNSLHLINRVVTITLFTVLLYSCELTSEQKQSSSDELESNCLPDEMVDRISVEEAKMGRVERSLKLPGKIEVNSDRVYRVFPNAGGVISDVHVREGDQVKKGEVLATIQSPDIAAFKRDMQHALAEKSIAKQNYSLAKSLTESGVYSRRDLLEAESKLEKIKSEITRLKEEQKVLGIEDDQPFYTIRAPESGFIIERNINPGTTLRNNDSYVFKISDLQDVWVVTNVPESDIGNIQSGDSVSITTLAFPDKMFNGKITRLSNSIDPNKRTMQAIIELPNPNYILKPGMFTNVKVKAYEDESFVHIPGDALIFDENKYYVVLFNDKCDVQIRPVTIKRRNNDRVFLKSGVNKGESVIFNRHILVYNQLIAKQ
ncbi:efflux RND transporter periplasmic adaptor subunit [Marinilabiliaceae bacterium ANBcel2]|nr:efflux RND transporter periplasmic adaptor subunit [Marinilabiliaceae bacterium ANBcel2]